MEVKRSGVFLGLKYLIRINNWLLFYFHWLHTHTPQKKQQKNKIVVRHGILNRLDPDTWNFFTNSVLPLDAYSIGSNFILHFLWIYSLSKLQSAGINNLPVWGSIYISGKIKRKRSTILRKIGAFHAKQYSVCNTSFSMFH